MTAGAGEWSLGEATHCDRRLELVFSDRVGFWLEREIWLRILEEQVAWGFAGLPSDVDLVLAAGREVHTWAAAEAVVADRPLWPKPSLMGRLNRFEEDVAEAAGSWGFHRLFHVGLTSSDVVDLRWALMFEVAGRQVAQSMLGCVRAVEAFVGSAKVGRFVAARTHGQPAQPVGVRWRLAGLWLETLTAFRGFGSVGVPRVLRGAVGSEVDLWSWLPSTVSNEEVGSVLAAFRVRFLRELGFAGLGNGFSDDEPRWGQQSDRSWVSSWVGSVSAVAGALVAAADNVRLLVMLESEGRVEGVGQSSSSMPQKRSLWLAERVRSLADVALSGATALAGADEGRWLEGDVVRYSKLRVHGPLMFCALGGAVDATTEMLSILRDEVSGWGCEVDRSVGLDVEGVHSSLALAQVRQEESSLTVDARRREAAERTVLGESAVEHLYGWLHHQDRAMFDRFSELADFVTTDLGRYTAPSGGAVEAVTVALSTEVDGG